MSKSFGGVIDIDVDGAKTRVAFTYHYEDSSIGSYEFQGQQGFEESVLDMCVEEIIPIFTDETEEQRQEVISFINSHFDGCAQEIKEKWAKI